MSFGTLIAELGINLLDFNKEIIIMLYYLLIFLLLLVAEVVYFRIEDKCNIIDKPNEWSSHASIVLRGLCLFTQKNTIVK